jgi:hypothetical protein
MAEPPHTMIVPLMKARLSGPGSAVTVDAADSAADVRRRLAENPDAVLRLAPERTPVLEPLLSDLYVAYAFDLPDSYRLVTPSDCADLGMKPEDLRLQAMVNLRMRRPSLEVMWYPDAKAAALALGGDLEAGLILDHGIVARLAQEFTGDLVAAIPARDILVVTGTAHPDGLAKLRWVVETVWENGDHLLTRSLLVRRQDEWQVFED